jgi:hypothetical protein
MRRALAVVAAVALVVLGTCARGVGAQEPVSSGPTITVDRASVTAGERVLVQLRNWDTRVVTLSVCGNLVRRGSTDCNMVNSQGVPMSRRSPETLSSLVVYPPPAACPCVIRASNPTQDKVAFAPLELIGHPVGPLVAPRDHSFVEMTVDAERATDGLWESVRSSLGGPTPYRLTVTVRNTSAETLTDVRVHGWGGRSPSDEARTLEIAGPPAIGPGQTWRRTVEVDTPAPYFGRFFWEVRVSGAGPTVPASAVTRHRPYLLILLVVVLAADLTAIVVRRTRRRRQAGRALLGDQQVAEEVRTDGEQLGVHDGVGGDDTAPAVQGGPVAERLSRA